MYVLQTIHIHFITLYRQLFQIQTLTWHNKKKRKQFNNIHKFQLAHRYVRWGVRSEDPRPVAMDIESISSIAGANGFRRSECAYICDIQRNFSPTEGLIWYIYLVYTAIIIYKIYLEKRRYCWNKENVTKLCIKFDNIAIFYYQLRNCANEQSKRWRKNTKKKKKLAFNKVRHLFEINCQSNQAVKWERDGEREGERDG